MRLNRSVVFSTTELQQQRCRLCVLLHLRTDEGAGAEVTLAGRAPRSWVKLQIIVEKVSRSRK